MTDRNVRSIGDVAAIYKDLRAGRQDADQLLNDIRDEYPQGNIAELGNIAYLFRTVKMQKESEEAELQETRATMQGLVSYISHMTGPDVVVNAPGDVKTAFEALLSKLAVAEANLASARTETNAQCTQINQDFLALQARLQQVNREQADLKDALAATESAYDVAQSRRDDLQAIVDGFASFSKSAVGNQLTYLFPVIAAQGGTVCDVVAHLRSNDFEFRALAMAVEESPILLGKCGNAPAANN